MARGIFAVSCESLTVAQGLSSCGTRAPGRQWLQHAGLAVSQNVRP